MNRKKKSSLVGIGRKIICVNHVCKMEKVCWTVDENGKKVRKFVVPMESAKHPGDDNMEKPEEKFIEELIRKDFAEKIFKFVDIGVEVGLDMESIRRLLSEELENAIDSYEFFLEESKTVGK